MVEDEFVHCETNSKLYPVMSTVQDSFERQTGWEGPTVTYPVSIPCIPWEPDELVVVATILLFLSWAESIMIAAPRTIKTSTKEIAITSLGTRGLFSKLLVSDMKLTTLKCSLSSAPCVVRLFVYFQKNHVEIVFPAATPLT